MVIVAYRQPPYRVEGMPARRVAAVLPVPGLSAPLRAPLRDRDLPLPSLPCPGLSQHPRGRPRPGTPAGAAAEMPAWSPRDGAGARCTATASNVAAAVRSSPGGALLGRGCGSRGLPGEPQAVVGNQLELADPSTSASAPRRPPRRGRMAPRTSDARNAPAVAGISRCRSVPASTAAALRIGLRRDPARGP